MGLRIEKGDRSISSVEDWFRIAPPKEGLRQWLDGRSAKELAKAFLETGLPAVPAEIGALLSSHEALGAIDLSTASPEHQIALDRFRGETRNADLVAVGTGKLGRIAVTVEAKADESFGRTIGEELARASSRSNVPRRIAVLSQAMFGQTGPQFSSLRYQLLHGSAGSLIFAKEQTATAAIFVVLEFCGPSCNKENLERNRRDLESFLEAFQASSLPLLNGRLCGPYRIPGGEFVPAGIPLFVGKATQNVSWTDEP